MDRQIRVSSPPKIINFDNQESVMARAAEAKLRAIFDNCFQFIALLDKQGRLLEINRGSLEVAKISRDEVIGYYFWDTFFWTKIIGAPYRDNFIKSWPQTCRGEFVRFEVAGVLPDGQAQTVDFSLTPVMNSAAELQYVVAEARDVTQYKLLEGQLLEKNRTLLRINAELEDFAVLASHDLRQPLQSISMNAAIMGQLLPKESSPELTEQLRHIKDGVARMNLLLESVLDFARSTKTSQEKSLVKCADVVREALDCLASSIDRADVRVDWASMPELMGNRLQLMRVFQNLLSNAIKFQSPDRDARVDVSCVDCDGHWIFGVSDNGIGIKPEDQIRLFRRFNQVSALESRVGLGAGLSICKDLIEQHGGRIWVNSILNQGTTFYFSLPK